MNNYQMYIDGKFCEAEGGARTESINPATEERIASFPRAGVSDLERAITAARRAYDEGDWPKFSTFERGQYLIRIAHLIRESAYDLSRIETADTGKTSKQTTFIDIPVAANSFEYFAGAAVEVKGETLNIPAPALSYTLREPVGVVGAITPWNYPFLMAAWKIASSIILGNTVVFKPSREASLSCLELAKILERAELPKGVVNIVTGEGAVLGEALASSMDVDMLTFTGSTEVGRSVMRAAASNLKRLTLELGGKSPNIVLADCDLETAANGSLCAIFMNQGQMCVAGSRLIVEEKIYDKFLELLVAKTKKLKIGDPADPATDIGPLITEKQKKRVLDYISIGKKEARLVVGGGVPAGLNKGYFVEPAIFADVRNDSRIAQEEIFGPVLCVLKAKDADEAVRIANDTDYGLAGMLWTKDLARATSIARSLRCGTVWVNTFGGFYNEAPFGGYKQSGFGRELGKEGLLEYTQVKHVNVDLTPGGKTLVASWFNV
ncbi:MAG TPA: aldehyde dehydrogenase [Candidatus Omnitrophica bacterium]|nr:aldehyde dehydrogenase [Candidatus Omnitrophota bacterium]